MCYTNGMVKTRFCAGKNIYSSYEVFFNKHLLHANNDVEYVALAANMEKRLQTWHGKYLSVIYLKFMRFEMSNVI